MAIDGLRDASRYLDEVVESGINTATTIDYSYKFDRELVNLNSI